jgi:hypothetical protein
MLATAAMALVVGWVRDQLDDPALRLVAGTACGALTYGATLFALWWLTGRPAGAERTLLVQLGGPLGRRVRLGLAGAPPA